MHWGVWIIAAVSMLTIFAIMFVVFMMLREDKKKEQEQRRKFGAGMSRDRDFHADFTAENIISIDYNGRKLRPELYENCKTISFKRILGVQIIRDSTVYTETKLKGATLNTFIGGALMGTPGAIIGACSGTPDIRVHENHRGWKVILHTDIKGAERLEIPFPKGRKLYIEKDGSRSYYKSQKLADEITAEIQRLEHEAGLDLPDNTADPVAEIRRYSGLLDEGVITDDEFERIKDRIINRL